MTRYDFLEARWEILSNVQTDSTWPNFDFGRLFMLTGVSNDRTNSKLT